MNERQRAFVRAHLANGKSNATAAAIAAGYSAKAARQQAHKLLQNPEIVAAIDSVVEIAVSDEEVMEQIELMRWWSHVVRTGERPVTRKLGPGDFASAAEYVQYLDALQLDSMKASENLGKALEMFSHNHKVDIDADGVQLQIVIPANGSEIDV